MEAPTFRINDITSPKAKAFLKYIKTLEFIVIDKTKPEKKKVEAILKLSDAQKNAIDKGLKDVEEGRVIPYKQAMAELKQRNPKYFK